MNNEFQNPEPSISPSSLTDADNAKRLIARHGDTLRYCYAWNKWLVWDRQRWTQDESGKVMRAAKETALAIYTEASRQFDSERARNIAKHADRSMSAQGLRAMVELARSEPGIPVKADELDADSWLLNVLNGTLDLRTGELREHNPTDLITKLAPVAYHADASCPTWMSFLNRIMNGNPDLTDFLQRAAGYSLTGQTTERVFFVLFGVGRNGKSTFLETFGALLDDYARVTPAEMLLAKKYDNNIPNDVAALKGARFVSASEAEQGKRLAEAKVKALTGGDTIPARFMRGEFFTFRPQFKLWLSTNHKPEVMGTDKGIWDRIRLIPFSVRITDDEVDARLPQKLRTELAGVLAWAVRGCLAWQQSGLGEPDAVRLANSVYRQEMDVLAEFLDVRCVRATNLTVPVSALYADYKSWCEQNGEHPLKQRQLSAQLQERGFVSKHDRAGAHWITLGLKDQRDVRDARDARDARNDISEPQLLHEASIPKNASHASQSGRMPVPPVQPARAA